MTSCGSKSFEASNNVVTFFTPHEFAGMLTLYDCGHYCSRYILSYNRLFKKYFKQNAKSDASSFSNVRILNFSLFHHSKLNVSIEYIWVWVLVSHIVAIGCHSNWYLAAAFQVVNLQHSEVQDRVMLTGRHMVRDVSCKNCNSKLGWVYEFATEESQRYKEGRVILERTLVRESEGFEHNPSDNSWVDACCSYSAQSGHVTDFPSGSSAWIWWTLPFGSRATPEQYPRVFVGSLNAKSGLYFPTFKI